MILSSLAWTLFIPILQFFMKNVNCFIMDIPVSAEDPWVKDLFREKRGVDFKHLTSGGITENLEKNVKFYLYTRESVDGQPYQIYKGCKKRLRASGFNPEHSTKILIHGFGGGFESPINGAYSAYLEHDDYNVIYVDWGRMCTMPWYKQAVLNVPLVGEYVGKMVDFLINVGNANPMDIHIVGHSLGAHVAGYAGSFLGFLKLGRITGLDPANVYYNFVPETERLNQNSALEVDVIHTNVAALGLEAPIGDIDYYPNGGIFQPGCNDLLGMCSHMKAVEYFIESIRNKNAYLAVKCFNLQDAMSGNCYTNMYGIMGDSIGNTLPGIYYVQILRG